MRGPAGGDRAGLTVSSRTGLHGPLVWERTMMTAVSRTEGRGPGLMTTDQRHFSHPCHIITITITNSNVIIMMFTVTVITLLIITLVILLTHISITATISYIVNVGALMTPSLSLLHHHHHHQWPNQSVTVDRLSCGPQLVSLPVHTHTHSKPPSLSLS